jgi:hypothetical protein
VTFVLPQDWWRVRLLDDEQRRRDIVALVRRATAGRADSGGLAAELTGLLEEVTSGAGGRHAVEMWLSLLVRRLRRCDRGHVGPGLQRVHRVAGGPAQEPAGILLCPQTIGDGDLVGVRLPRSAVGGPVQPGRGLLHDGSGGLTTVQIPVPG